MKSPLPYHFCQIGGCTNMTPLGMRHCDEHLLFNLMLATSQDCYFPEIEALAGPSLSPDASRELQQPSPVGPSDAGIHKESQT